MILLWDVDSGLAQIDKYFHSNDNHVIAGALLGVGIVNCSIKNDCDPVGALIFSSAEYNVSNISLNLNPFSRRWLFWVNILIKKIHLSELVQ